MALIPEDDFKGKFAGRITTFKTMSGFEEDVAAAIEPLVAVVEPLINAAIEQIKAVPDNTNETP